MLSKPIATAVGFKSTILVDRLNSKPRVVSFQGHDFFTKVEKKRGVAGGRIRSE